MAEEVLSRVLAALSSGPRDQFAQGLCDMCGELLGVTGATVAVATDGAHPTSICSSDEVGTALADLQATLGQGPSVDAHRDGVAIVEPDLESSAERWIGFAVPALALGTRALFAFPLRVGAARLGVLTLHRDQPGLLDREAYIDALATAHALTQAILAVQAHAPLDAGSGALQDVAGGRAEVHQATGMVAARFEIGVGDALVLLRAHAYAVDRPLLDVSRDVVDRRLHLELP